VPGSAGAIFGGLMVALPLYFLLALVGAAIRLSVNGPRGAEGNGRIGAQQGAGIDDIIKTVRRREPPPPAHSEGELQQGCTPRF
jgi:hypothetical protein